MSRIDKIYQIIKDLSDSISKTNISEGFNGFTTEEVCAKIDAGRTNVSKELNTLTKQGALVKVWGRPVRYFSSDRLSEIFGVELKANQEAVKSLYALVGSSLKEQSGQFVENFHTNPASKAQEIERIEENFEEIVKKSPSLNPIVRLGKAAVVYPPNGLHTLLTGPSGSGKTFFAEAMYNYAKKNEYIASSAKFVIFNCAEYADNPQLLLSQLFGYVKGAFTGADSSREGLIDKANNGVLLLDEVHRLPPQGQEMLFTLIDKGVFRRVGESGTEHNVNIRIICATTENIKASILTTFTRRFPMTITLPSLTEYPIHERYALVERFFRVEAKNLNLDIEVSTDVIGGLLMYQPKGNIGQLKGDIQILCAKAFLEHKIQEENQKKPLLVSVNHLSDEFCEEIAKMHDQSTFFESLPFLTNAKTVVFSGNSICDCTNTGINTVPLYDKISQLYQILSKENVDEQDIQRNIANSINKYFDVLVNRHKAEADHNRKDKLLSIVDQRVFETSVEIIKLVENYLNKKIRCRVLTALTLHISAMLERLSINYSFDVTEEKLNLIYNKNTQDFKVALQMKKIIEDSLNIVVPETEIAFFVAFIHYVQKDETSEESKVGLIIVAHGKSTASSMAEAVNEILNSNHCKAVDMDISEDAESCLRRVTDMVPMVDEGLGVLLLVDMGSLTSFAEIIRKKTDVNVACVSMVSTPIALEAARKCIYSNDSMDAIAKHLSTKIPFMGNNLPISAPEKKLIAVTCMSGEGAAVMLCDLISKNVPIVEKLGIEVVPFDVYGRDMDDEMKERVILVAGAADLHIENAPYVPVEEIIMGNGLKRIGLILDEIEGTEENSRNVPPNYAVSNILNQYLTFLNPAKVSTAIEEAYETVAQQLEFENSDKTKLRFLIHCCFMVERLVRNQALDYAQCERVLAENSDLNEFLIEAFKKTETLFDVSVPDTERAYIIDLINTL